MTVLASCDSEEGRVTGTWQGRRFGTDVRTLTLEDSHGRLSGSCGAARKPLGDGPIDVLTGAGGYLGSLRADAAVIPDAFGPDGLVAIVGRKRVGRADGDGEAGGV